MKSSQRYHLHRLAEKLVTPARYGRAWPKHRSNVISIHRPPSQRIYDQERAG